MMKKAHVFLVLNTLLLVSCNKYADKYVFTLNPTYDSEGIVSVYYRDGTCREIKVPPLSNSSFYTLESKIPSTCSKKGEEIFKCRYGTFKNELDLDPNAHHFSEQFRKEPTVDEEGYIYYTCDYCKSAKAEEIEKIESKFFISIYDYDSKQLVKKQGVDETGQYNLNATKRRGYNFVKFLDENGNDFPTSGVISKDINIYGKYTLEDTIVVNNFQELENAINNDKVFITINSDICITNTLYIQDETYINSNGNYTIKRDESFDGDMFLIGVDSNLLPSTAFNKHPYLNLGYGMGSSNSITIDGNKSNLSVNVKGSAFALLYSSRLNIYDNVSIINNKKVGNTISYIEELELAHPDEVGGAGIVNISSEVNLYGGSLSNNEVNIDESSSSSSTQGGAIYNYGTLNVYNSSLDNNSSSRGAAIYNYRTVNIYKGLLTNNHSAYYGSCIYCADSQHGHVNVGNDDTILGDIVFQDNVSDKSGGVFFGLKSPAFLINKAKFINNKVTSGNGGVINCGGVLTIRNSYFENNSCSSKGGAIYSYYNDPTGETSARQTLVENCTFLNNTAKYGGAISNLSENENKILKLDIVGSSFKNNNATSGGAIYTNGYSFTTISSTEFVSNVSKQNGGAIYSYGQATLNIGIKDDDSSIVVFDSNSCGEDKYFGGGLYISNSGDFSSSDPTKHKISNFYNVEAKNNVSFKGGFMYCTCGDEKYNDTYIFKGLAMDNIAKSTEDKKGDCIFINTERSLLYIPNYGTASCNFTHNGNIDLTDGEIIKYE